MKASLLARPATALLLAATLAGGFSTAGVAATTATTAADQGANGTAATAPSTMTNATAPSTQNGTAAGTTASGSQDATSQNLEQMANQRIADLHTQLSITGKQEPAWNKFAGVMRANARELDQAYQQRAQNFDTMSAVQNMRSYAKIEQMRARDVEKLVPPFQSLYASLTPQQKHQADTLFRNRAEAAQQQRQNAANASR